VGLVTTHRDPQGRPTVFEHLPAVMPRVISVGRLDLNSEGLLLLTNDGELARALELPANRLERRYRARARGRADQAMLDRLKDGLTADGVRYGPIEARLDENRTGGVNQWITLTLSEGKNREVRKVLEAFPRPACRIRTPPPRPLRSARSRRNRPPRPMRTRLQRPSPRRPISPAGPSPRRVRRRASPRRRPSRDAPARPAVGPARENRPNARRCRRA
jgi:23S rRNA pseudouridine2605 synthase